jgi:hypothetical protein
LESTLDELEASDFMLPQQYGASRPQNAPPAAAAAAPHNSDAMKCAAIAMSKPDGMHTGVLSWWPLS